MNAKLVRVGSWLLRIALAMAFLSAVADRFGLWGPPGSPGVGWGDLTGFNAYVAKLNWFVPAGLIPVVGWASTAAERRWTTRSSPQQPQHSCSSLLSQVARTKHEYAREQQNRQRSNQSMKPTAPLRKNSKVFVCPNTLPWLISFSLGKKE